MGAYAAPCGLVARQTMASRTEQPRVVIEMPYNDALRLSYMARFPQAEQPMDWVIADTVDAAIHRAERAAGDFSSRVNDQEGVRRPPSL